MPLVPIPNLAHKKRSGSAFEIFSMKDSAIGQAPAQATSSEKETTYRPGGIPWRLVCRADLDRHAGGAWSSFGGTIAVGMMMDVFLTDEALELLKLLEKGAKHTPEGTALELLREHGFAMGSPLKTHVTQKGVRYLTEMKAAVASGAPLDRPQLAELD